MQPCGAAHTGAADCFALQKNSLTGLFYVCRIQGASQNAVQAGLSGILPVTTNAGCLFPLIWEHMKAATFFWKEHNALQCSLPKLDCGAEHVQS